MQKSLPPLTWFRSFEAAARHLSFTQAADEIGLTQSAVSQQVRSLEMRLGVTLFVRQARGLALTDDGRQLLPKVEDALETLTAAANDFSSGSTDRLLTVAASISIVQWVIAPNLPAFSRQHPDVRLRFLSAIWPDDFQSARADVEIRFGSQRQVGKRARQLLPGRLVAIKSPHLTGRLKSLPLIESVGTSSGWSAWAEKHGGVGEPVVYADTYGMAMHMAAHGNGVALVSECLIGHALREGTLERAHSKSIAAREGYFLSIQEDQPMATVFGNWLQGILL